MAVHRAIVRLRKEMARNIQDPDESRFIELASFIDDDQPIDWDSAEEGTRDALERAVVAELRVVAGLTGALRRPDDHTTTGSTDEAQEPSPAMTPKAWGPLVILEPIGRGAFGTVYRARDTLGREVALKLFTAGPEQDSAKAQVPEEARLLPASVTPTSSTSTARIGRMGVLAVDGTDPGPHPGCRITHARQVQCAGGRWIGLDPVARWRRRARCRARAPHRHETSWWWWCQS